MKFKKQIIITILILSLINLVSAISIYSGENYTFSIDTTDNLIYDVVGNSSNMEGFYVYQDIYDTYSNITFSTDINFASDSFTVILFSNETKEVIKEVPVPGDCPSCGGGGTRTVYVDRNNTEYIVLDNCEGICDNQTDINQTIDLPIDESEKIGLWKRFWNWLKRIFRRN